MVMIYILNPPPPHFLGPHHPSLKAGEGCQKPLRHIRDLASPFIPFLSPRDDRIIEVGFLYLCEGGVGALQQAYLLPVSTPPLDPAAETPIH